MARGMFATVLSRLESAECPQNKLTFVDVDPGLWYGGPIAWASEMGYVRGYGSEGTFGSNDIITREQMAVMMMRYAESQGVDTSARADITGFGDAGDLSFGKEAMSWAVAAGLLQGYEGSDDLGALNSTTRAEASTIFERLIRYMIIGLE